MLNTAKPTQAFTFAAWAALVIGAGAYLIGLFNATVELNEKGYFLICLLFGLYSAISLQKSVRDRMEDIPVTPLYFNISWVALGSAIVLLIIGLWNAHISLSEKGFFLMGFTLCLFAAITVQKNTRDLQKNVGMTDTSSKSVTTHQIETDEKTDFTKAQ